MPACMCYRVIKQVLHSSGANVTEKHIKDVSLSGLFLMEAAKKADRAFGAPPPSTRHTVTDASSDIKKITEHLLEKNATTEVTARSSPAFKDPTEEGWKKLSCTEWIQKILTNTLEEDLQEEQRGETDLDYELYDV